MIKLFYCLTLVFLLNACSEKGKIADEMKEIPKFQWSYNQIPDFGFEVKQPQLYHQFYLKLRIQKSYPFENLYLLAHIKDAQGKISTQRVNLTLADVDGKPLGKTSGNSINYELPLFVNKKMEGGPGQYFIAIEQNMRDSIINGVESIGVKIKEGDPIF
jgi:gliding motility-associated lipoprotein GldH